MRTRAGRPGPKGFGLSLLGASRYNRKYEEAPSRRRA